MPCLQPLRNTQFVVDYSLHIRSIAQPITSPESKVEIFRATIPKYASRKPSTTLRRTAPSQYLRNCAESCLTCRLEIQVKSSLFFWYKMKQTQTSSHHAPWNAVKEHSSPSLLHPLLSLVLMTEF